MLNFEVMGHHKTIMFWYGFNVKHHSSENVIQIPGLKCTLIILTNGQISGGYYEGKLIANAI